MTVKILTKEKYEIEISKNKVTAIDFHANWCSPCKQLAPMMEEISNEINQIGFYKVDVDEEQQLAQQFSIMSVPTIIILKEGKEALRITGIQPKNNLKEQFLSKI